jgi:hypothetical protein
MAARAWMRILGRTCLAVMLTTAGLLRADCEHRVTRPAPGGLASHLRERYRRRRSIAEAGSGSGKRSEQTSAHGSYGFCKVSSAAALGQQSGAMPLLFWNCPSATRVAIPALPSILSL